MNKVDERLEIAVGHIESIAEISQGARAELREYREHLESLMDRVVKSLYIVAAFIVGAAGLLGIKTWWDIEKTVRQEAKARVVEVLEEHFIQQTIENQIAEYRQNSIATYWALRIGQDPSEGLTLGRQDYDSIRSVLDRPSSPAFQDALAVLKACFQLDKEQSQLFVSTLIMRLKDEWEGGKSDLTDQQEEDIVRALGNCHAGDAADLLVNSISNGKVGLRARIAACEVLPLVSIGSDQQRLVATLLDDIRSDTRSARLARLRAVTALHADSAMPVLHELAESSDEADIYLFAELIDGLVEDTQRRSFVDPRILPPLLAGFLTNAKVKITPELRSPEVGVVATIAGWPLSTNQFYSRLMHESVNLAIQRTSPKEFPSFLRRIVIPLISMGDHVLALEITEGHLGRAPDVFAWLDGFFVSGVAGSDVILLEVEGSEAIFLAQAEGDQPPVEVRRPATAVTPTNLRWRLQSKTARVKAGSLQGLR